MVSILQMPRPVSSVWQTEFSNINENAALYFESRQSPLPTKLVTKVHEPAKYLQYDALQFYVEDLLSPQVADVKLLRWMQQDQSSLPDSPV